METDNRFLPPRRDGLFFHCTAAALLAGGSGLSLWFALQQAVGASFVLLLILPLAFVPLLALVLYRGYALLQAGYALERDGLHLHWGLRVEDIPLPDVEWVRPANELGFDLPLPFLRLPGAILGERTIEGLGLVEFMAADTRKMLLVATPTRIFAISPADPNGFLRAFQRATEMGSLSPILPRTSLPAAYLQLVWKDQRARSFILAGLGLMVLLFVFVSLMIPTRTAVSLGFDADRVPLPGVPSERLLLLPVLAAFAFAMDLIGGLFFYRRSGQRPVAYLLWASSAMTALLLAAAVLFIL
ncbi:MAG: PH domain-containing protein [Anaerolineaceae bacterium]|nr:PH domain-containing protein [Anaerolineaceae bacterium]